MLMGRSCVSTMAELCLRRHRIGNSILNILEFSGTLQFNLFQRFLLCYKHFVLLQFVKSLLSIFRVEMSATSNFPEHFVRGVPLHFLYPTRSEDLSNISAQAAVSLAVPDIE